MGLIVSPLCRKVAQLALGWLVWWRAGHEQAGT
jgi:hypothetical protein